MNNLLDLDVSADEIDPVARSIRRNGASPAMSRKIRVGVIGFGRMGRGFVSVMQHDDRWEIVSICDTQANTRELAGRTVPTAKIISKPDEIFNDKSLDAVGLFTLADARPELI